MQPINFGGAVRVTGTRKELDKAADAAERVKNDKNIAVVGFRDGDKGDVYLTRADAEAAQVVEHKVVKKQAGGEGLSAVLQLFGLPVPEKTIAADKLGSYLKEEG